MDSEFQGTYCRSQPCDSIQYEVLFALLNQLERHSRSFTEDWCCSEECVVKSAGEDHVLNMSRSIMYHGLKFLARRDAVRNGDGAAIVADWRLNMPSFWKRHPKYIVNTHFMLACKYIHIFSCNPLTKNSTQHGFFLMTSWPSFNGCVIITYISIDKWHFPCVYIRNFHCIWENFNILDVCYDPVVHSCSYLSCVHYGCQSPMTVVADAMATVYW